MTSSNVLNSYLYKNSIKINIFKNNYIKTDQFISDENE